ncbi:hypothetical protein JCGZ_00766 [Jatropha curcas]|uniref:Uncharacterized protein n=1 Tax=Jatropha curcas TaxID=180498 RepID=A0A067L4I9_JATCU|nr:uncharacterized protein LOC105632857 [Jatropha curcas]KDP39009.1 hypothetical protein JCGZ_00766 [Jatropha curcas]
MGGGAAVRAAAKVAGIGVVSSGIRGGFSAVPSPAEQSVRNVSRPVSAIISSSQGRIEGGFELSGVQKPAWELEDWELAGGEEELLIESSEPMPRVVFGAPPSLNEAKAATADLKDALEKVYLSSPAHSGAGGSFGSSRLSGLSLVTNSDDLDTKRCIADDLRANSAPKCAVTAFKLLNESPEAQTVVASIASDPNVWDAVWKNVALQEFLQSQKTNAELQDPGSPRAFTELSDDSSETEKSENKPIDIFENIKQTVAEMVNSVSSMIQQIFGFATAENTSSAADEDSQPTFFDKTLGASFMALAVMVIAVVVLKRG